MPIEIDKEDFLEKFNFNEEEFEACNINWEELNKIYDDYLTFQPDFKKHAEFVSKILRDHSNVHSVRSRVKDPEHLIAKLIRKTKQRQGFKENPNFQFTVDNYRNEITDLVGVRALHIFKEEWKEIHRFITEKWETVEEEAKIRAGDDKQIYADEGISVQNYDSGYRSVHYIIKSKPTNFDIYTEIQVRTIFEEGYGEIDHRLSYPQKNVSKVLDDNLLLLNRLAGSADEMSSHIINLKNSIEDSEKELIQKIIENEKLQEEIEELKEKVEKSDMDKNDKSSFVSSLDSIKRSYDMPLFFKDSDVNLSTEPYKINSSNLTFNTNHNLITDSNFTSDLNLNTSENAYTDLIKNGANDKIFNPHQKLIIDSINNKSTKSSDDN